MVLPVRVTRRAALQIRSAATWWRKHRSAAPDAIEDELAHAFSLLASDPGLGLALPSVRPAGVRRLHLQRVHYYLYYREDTAHITVLAFWHTRRGVQPTHLP